MGLSLGTLAVEELGGMAVAGEVAGGLAAGYEGLSGLTAADATAAGADVAAGAGGAGATAGYEGLSGLTQADATAAAGDVAGGAMAGGAAAAPVVDPGITSLASSGTAGGDLAGSAPGITPAGTTATGIPTSAATVAEGSGAGAPAGVAAEQAGAPVVDATISPNAPASSGGWGDTLSKGAKALGLVNAAGTGIGSTALPAAGMAMNAYSQVQGNKALGNMQQQLKNTVSNLGPTQQALIDQYNKGTLSAADSQGIQDWVTQSKAQIRQQYASSGLGNSDMAKQAEAAIDAKAQAMTDQALKNYLSSAIQTTGAMTGPYAGLAQQQIQQDAALQAASANVFKAAGAQTAASNPGAPAAE